MGALARRLGENEQEWQLVGLLHDLDYDEVKDDMSKHGLIAAEKLKTKLPEHCLYAIKVHDYRTGVKPESKLDKALIAVDSVATVVERNGKAIKQLDVAELNREVEYASVNQPWLKDNIFLCKDLGLDANGFLELCLTSIKKQTR
jgi:predicted hydrolase (HD superfamily)